MSFSVSSESQIYVGKVKGLLTEFAPILPLLVSQQMVCFTFWIQGSVKVAQMGAVKAECVVQTLKLGLHLVACKEKTVKSPNPSLKP